MIKKSYNHTLDLKLMDSSEVPEIRQIIPEDTVRQRLTSTPFDKVEVEVVVPSQTYKSLARFMIMGLALSISSFEFGYAFCEISTVPNDVLIQQYNIELSGGAITALLVGMMPVGGIFGCLLNRLFLNWFSRKNAHYVVTVLNLIELALVQINTFPTLVVGRVILGVCCGIYTAIAPQYIKEIAPPKLRPLMGSFFSLGRVIGAVFCYALGVIFYETNVENFYRIMFTLPAGFAVLQCILIFFFVPDSPVEMLEKYQHESLREYVVEFYKPECVDMVVKEHEIEFEAMQAALLAAKNSNDPNYIDPLKSNKNRAFVMAIHLNIYRQFIGVNCIVAFAGTMIGSMDPVLGPYVNLILNAIQLVATIISTFWLGTLFGRRPLYLVSGVLIGICNLLVFVGFLQNIELLIVIFFILYMVFFGLFFAPVSWSYPSEIIPATLTTMATTFTWIALAITTLIPPIIMQAMDNNAWVIFLFFTVYTFISLVYMWVSLTQTKGLKYKQIIQKY